MTMRNSDLRQVARVIARDLGDEFANNLVARIREQLDVMPEVIVVDTPTARRECIRAVNALDRAARIATALAILATVMSAASLVAFTVIIAMMSSSR